jgi:Carboxypeptidase regulatory-like domain
MKCTWMQSFFGLGGYRDYRPVSRWGTFWIALVALLLLAPPARAQDNATITGAVNDASGAVVPNAALSLENPGTGQIRETKSNEAGVFRFANVGVGTYTLSATAAGFQKSTRTGIVVNVAQTVGADMTLTVGSAEQSITVEAQALQVQTETSEISTLISGEQVRQLATNGRNVVQLAALGLGVSNQLASFGGIDALTSSNALSFNGQRVAHNVYLIDGAEQNDRGCGGCFMNLPSQDAIGEFQTLGSNYAADYGIGSGGTITMVIKSGSRQFHGSLYEFNRNTAYNANDYFLKRSTPPKSRPIFQLNTPGGNIGGPLWIPHVYNEQKNRTFFFWNEEWRKMIKGTVPSITNDLWSNNFPTVGADLNYTPQSSTIPIVPNFRDADGVPSNPAYDALETGLGLTPGSPFPKNSDGTYRIPAAMIDQNIVRQLNAGTFPKPNYNCTGPVCKQFIISVKQPENIREDVVRIDHAINSKFQLMGHYLHDAMENTFYPPLWAGSFATVGTAMKNPSYTAAIKLTQTYSPSLLNETAFFYSGNKIRLSPLAAPGASYSVPSGWDATSLFPSDNQAAITHGMKQPIMPQIQTSGTLSATWNPSYFPWKNGYEGFQYRDDLSWTKGRHQFKFGVGWLHTYKNQELQANTNGNAQFNTDAFTKDSIANMMLGIAASYTQLEYLWGKHWVNNNYSFYAIDNWHVGPRLTLNLGLRYDGLPHAFERYNKFANFVPGSYNKTTGNPIKTDNTLDPSQLTKYSGGNFYLNGIHSAGVDGFPKGNVENRYYTWQPRIGFAYDLHGGGKTVLRGGAGVFYERVQGNDVYNSALNPPFAYQPAPTNVFFSEPTRSVTTGAIGTSLYPSNLTSIKYNYPPPGTMNWSLGIQHQLMPSVVSAVQYVGSSGWDQNDTRQINTLPLTNDPSNYYSTGNGHWAFTPLADPNWNSTFADRYAVRSGQIVANKLRQYPGFGNINQEENETNAHYHSLQAGVRFEEKWGLTSQVAYTYSHLLDSAPGTGDLQTLNNPFNPAYSRGSGSYDRRHIFNMSYVYSLPFAKHSSNMVYKTLVGGWGISGITVFQTGNPIQILYNGGDTLGLGGGTSNRPNLVGKIRYPKQVLSWFNNGQNGTDLPFADPVAPWLGGPNNGFGNAGKDNVRGPGLNNWNLSLLKRIQLAGSDNGPNIELRFESFNTFNKTQFSGVNANTKDGNFGQVTSVYSNRVLELGGKFRF